MVSIPMAREVGRPIPYRAIDSAVPVHERLTDYGIDGTKLTANLYRNNHRGKARYGVLFSPGFTFSSEATAERIMHILDQDAALIVPNLRAHGQGGFYSEGRIDVDRMIEDTSVFLPYLHQVAKEAIHVGTSLGGYTTARYPVHRDTKIVLISTPESLSESFKRKNKKLKWLYLATQGRRRIPHELNGYLERIVKIAGRIHKTERGDMGLGYYRTNGIQDILYDMDQIRNSPDLSSSINIDSPALLVRGSEDEMITEEETGMIRRKLQNPGSSLLIVDGAGHDIRGYEDQVIDSVFDWGKQFERRWYSTFFPQRRKAA